MMHRQLLTDRFVCVVREGHPSVGKRLTLPQYVSLPHLQVAPRGRPGGYIDDELGRVGHTRRVARAVPYFVTALRLLAATDYVLTISERIARAHAAALGLRVLEAPLELRPYALSLVWHPRFEADEAHRFVREAFVAAARARAGVKHANPRTRLDPSDPTTGRRRRA
jgi:DNA-binding transcriptional LysR family regulator